MSSRVSVAKFGGSLLDREGRGIPKIVRSIKELKKADGVGPVVVFSAPTGCTDELIEIGEGCAQSNRASVAAVFKVYDDLAQKFVRAEYAERASADLSFYRVQTEDALGRVNKRFSGNVKAKVLTFGGELATSALMNYVLLSHGVDSVYLRSNEFPVVTDDDFEDATPSFELSRKRLKVLTAPLRTGKVVCMAGFFGVTSDGLETVLGRGGSDLSAVFVSCLLKGEFDARALLYKDVPVQSADPKVVRGQKTWHVAALTYNEAHKASLTGMKIVQSSAIALARQFGLPLWVVPIDAPADYSIIQAENSGGQVVKCLTGKTGCAILSMRDDRSRSLEDALRVWERRNDFLDLGAEALETGERVRDFLFLDSDFLRRNEERFRGFDRDLRVEYGLGGVTLIGDRMRDSPGVASLAIGSIQGLNIKRGIFAPHTSQIIIVLDEGNVRAAVAAIHFKLGEPNRSVG